MATYKLKNCFFIILLSVFLFPTILFGQNIALEGRVTDKSEPLPFVSISIKNTSIGTISNGEGKFRLVVPQRYLNDVISISLMGYQTREVKIKAWEKDIQLEKADFMLPEVSIMPEDSMLRFMKKAVNRIAENYLSTPTRQTGFYRTMLKCDTAYQYFGEALLDVYKPSYRNREAGSVKIINSRINRGVENKEMSSLYFYGGIYLPFLADYVQQREAFLNPAEFKHYNYSMDEIIRMDDQVIYKIAFKPKEPDKGKYEGFFHIDQKTLAFLDFQFSYSPFGCEQRSRSLSYLKGKLNSLNGLYVIKYALIDNRYFLKYILYSEDIQDVSSGIVYKKTNEYLTSEMDKENTNPIPLDEQDMLSTVFSVKATSVNESTWKDYNVLNSQPMQLALSEQQAKQLLMKNKSQRIGFSSKEKITKLVMRMQSSFYVSSAKLYNKAEITSFLYRPANEHTFQLGKPVVQPENQVNLGMSLGYNLSNRFSVLMAEEYSLNADKWKLYSLGLSYNIGLKSYGKRLLLSPQLSVNSMNYGIYMGEFNNTEAFKAGNRKISADKFRLYIGEKAFGLQPGVMLKKDLSRTLKLFLGVDYCWKINSQSRLFIEESSGFMFRRKTSIPLNSPQVTYSMNPTGLEKDAFNASFINFKVGIILGR
ncbi:MAG TPA: carboxypeptidase-like regulatory domain-containing protein [Prolixibacteraceae bacterium]|nr:carboxypeptidase-like regulatory domain-containing protein [Prolixibacteraceae bacterium]